MPVIVSLLQPGVVWSSRSPPLGIRSVPGLDIHAVSRVANRPGFPGSVSKLTFGVPCPGQGRFFPGIFHKVLQHDTLRYEMLS